MSQSDAPKTGVAMLARAGFSAEQIELMFRALMPDVLNTSNSEILLEDLAHRLAATGLPGDLARHWAERLDAEFDGHPLARELVEELIPQLHSGAVSAADGARLARQLEGILAEMRRPPADVIDTTAVTVPDRGVPASAVPTGGAGW